MKKENKFSRVLILVLIFILLILIGVLVLLFFNQGLTGNAFWIFGNDNKAVVSWSGSGSLVDPYVITNCTQLQNMNQDLNANYVLGNDIDCSETRNWNGGLGFDPIGRDRDRFGGRLDGRNHTISTLYMYRPLEDDTVGLFGAVSGAILLNMGLADANITGSYWAIGALAGIASRSSIENVYSTGYISSEDEWGAAIGGLVGYVEEATNISLSCSNSFVIAGGEASNFIGSVWSDLPNSNIKDSCSAGKVITTHSYEGSGGVVGNSNSLNLSNVFSISSLFGGDKYLGIVVGSLSGGDTLTNSYYFNSSEINLDCIGNGSLESKANCRAINNVDYFLNWSSSPMTNWSYVPFWKNLCINSTNYNKYSSLNVTFPYCGDNNCSNNEDCSSCPGDCGSCSNIPSSLLEFLSLPITPLLDSDYIANSIQTSNTISFEFKGDYTAKNISSYHFFSYFYSPLNFTFIDSRQIKHRCTNGLNILDYNFSGIPPTNLTLPYSSSDLSTLISLSGKVCYEVFVVKMDNTRSELVESCSGPGSLNKIAVSCNKISGEEACNLSLSNNLSGNYFINLSGIKYNITVSAELFSFKNPHGGVEFLQAINGSVVLNKDFIINNNFVYVNSFNLNKPAKISFYNIPLFSNPKILRNGNECNYTTTPACFNFTSLNASIVIFNVSSWSNYSIGGDYIIAYCGDGTCNNGETCSSCQGDCGSCSSDTGSSGSGGGGGGGGSPRTNIAQNNTNAIYNLQDINDANGDFNLNPNNLGDEADDGFWSKEKIKWVILGGLGLLIIIVLVVMVIVILRKRQSENRQLSSFAVKEVN